MNRLYIFAALILFTVNSIGRGEAPQVDTARGDRMLTEYFRVETEKLRKLCLADVKSLDDWQGNRDENRRRLLEMLALDPLPERTDL